MSPRVAVVEDNPDNRMLVEALLEDRYELSEYENGREVVEGLGNNVPDLVRSIFRCPKWMARRFWPGYELMPS